MFVTLLHLITLAILIIATMEKVTVNFGKWWVFIFRMCEIADSVCNVWSLFLSLGGCGKGWKPQTYGTAAGMTTPQKAGCVHPTLKLVSFCSRLYIAVKWNSSPSKVKMWLREWFTSSEWLQAVQVLMVLSVVFSSVSFLVFLGLLFTMSRGGLFYFTGLCQIFAGNSGVK